MQRVAGKQRAVLISNKVREKVREHINFAKFFFRNRGSGSLGFGLCPEGGMVPSNMRLSMPRERNERKQPLRFDGIGVGLPGHQVLKSTHGETITPHAFDMVKNSFGPKASVLLDRKLIVKWSQKPDFHDPEDNNKGHCYNSHEVKKGRDPGDALKRIRLCAEAFEIAALGPNMVEVALKKLENSPLVNLAGGIRHEIDNNIPFELKEPKKIGFIGKLAFRAAWLGNALEQVIDDILNRFFPRGPSDADMAQAKALSMILGQMLHYVQDIKSIVHTAGHVDENGNWVMEMIGKHAKLEYEIVAADSLGQIEIRQRRSPDSFFERGMAAHRTGWIDKLVETCREEAVKSRSEMDDFEKMLKENENPITLESMGKMVNDATDVSAYVILACAMACEKASVGAAIAGAPRAAARRLRNA